MNASLHSEPEPEHAVTSCCCAFLLVFVHTDVKWRRCVGVCMHKSVCLNIVFIKKNKKKTQFDAK